MPARTTSASPSPPPRAPIAATPGPRATAFQKVFADALSHTLRANSYVNFSACFPTPAKHCPQSLEHVWKQLNTKLEESAGAEFGDILRERGVVESLNEWDRVVEEAKTRKGKGGVEDVGAGPHTLGAEDLYNAHLVPFLREAEQTLDTRIHSTQEDNRQLMEVIRQQRQNIENLVGGLETVVQDLEGAVEVMGKDEAMGALRKETFEMEDEMAIDR